jgi:hypothetical protein
LRWRTLVLVVSAFAIEPRAASAQQWECYPLAVGETAAGAAARVAGDARSIDGQQFQILDPTTSQFVSKRRYGRIRPGWLACTWNTRGGAVQLVNLAPTVRNLAPEPPWAERALGDLRPDPLWYLLVLLLLIALATSAITRRWKERQAAIAVMTRFGHAVIGEFERPLQHPRDSAPALRSRLRMKPHRNRLEVLLAPAAGRTYPNLSDHRKNVEYDIERVRRALGNEFFVSDSLRQRGRWVVLSFRATRNKDRQVSCERPSAQPRWWRRQYSAFGEGDISARPRGD